MDSFSNNHYSSYTFLNPWALLKKHICPKSCDPPTAMVNKKGNLVTNQDDIKELASKHIKKDDKIDQSYKV